MKPEPSEVKTDQSIKTGLNLESHPFSNKWRGLFLKNRNVRNRETRIR